MSKIIKIYVKTAAEEEPDIFCIKLDKDCTLVDLKNKIYLRCPQLSDKESQVYWIDDENDKINIVCDDDFKFFMTEDACEKLIMSYCGGGTTKLRKRSIDSEYDIISEYTKKVRKALQSIEITSDEGSDMEIEACGGKSYDCRNFKPANVTDAIQASAEPEPIPSTSGENTNEVKTPSSFSYNSLECSSIEVVGDSIMDLTKDDSAAAINVDEEANTEKVRIIDVEVIKPAEDEIKIVEIPVQMAEAVANDENGNRIQPEVIICGDPPIEVEEPVAAQASSAVSEAVPPPKRKLSNRISISDSEDENDTNNNSSNANQHAEDRDHNGNNSNQQRQYSSAYAFTNLNGDRFESATRTETAGGRRRHFHRTRCHRPNYRRSADEPSSFQEQMRSFHRANADNFERIQENIRATGEHVQRTFSATAQMFPDLATTFRSHFVRPLFGEGVHEHFFNSGYRH